MTDAVLKVGESGALLLSLTRSIPVLKKPEKISVPSVATLPVTRKSTVPIAKVKPTGPSPKIPASKVRTFPF